MAATEEIAMAMVQRIQEQMERCSFHDVIVTVKGITFECHRFVLSASSRFFRAMFSSGMTEDLNRKVELKGIDPDIFSLILDCVYKARYVLTPENIISVWHASNMLQIDFLIDSCEKFLTNHLSVDTSVEIYLHAKLLDSQILKKLSWDIIVTNFDRIRKTEDIMMLEYDDMMKMVADDALNVPSEDMVVEVILRWSSFIPEERTEIDGERSLKASSRLLSVSNESQENQMPTFSGIECTDESSKLTVDPGTVVKTTSKGTVSVEESLNRKHINGREEKLFSLLSVARICLMSGSYIQALTENKLVKKYHKAYALVMEGLRYQLQPGRRHDYCPPYAMHRSSSKFRNVTIAIIQQEKNIKMLCRSIDGSWISLASPPIEHINCTAIIYGSDIYVTGVSKIQRSHVTDYSSSKRNLYRATEQNYVPAESTAQPASMGTFRYCCNTNTWRQCNVLSTNRRNHALVSLYDYIYAIGGINCTDVQRFRVNDEGAEGCGRWETVGKLNIPVSDVVVTTFEGNILVFGNVDCRSPYAVIQCFSTQTMSAYTCRLNMLGSIKKVVTFKQSDGTYLLEETGALWKLTFCGKDTISMEYMDMIWDIPLELSAAVICNETLLILATKIDPQMSRKWDTLSNPVFKRVKIIEREANCFFNAVIPKSILDIKDDS